MMAAENVECNAFLQMNETLSMGIREALLSIADAALSRKIIHENTHSEVALNSGRSLEVRSQTFLRAIRDRIRLDRSAFHVFVSILESQHSMEYLAIKLKESLHEETENLQRRQAASITHTNSSNQVEMVLNGDAGGRFVPRPTQLVAPGEQLHSYARMQPVQLPTQPGRFANWSLNHSHASLHRNSPTTQPATTMGDHEPHSEPVVKYNTSPGMVFRKNIVLGGSNEGNTSSTSDFNDITRRAITPGAGDSRMISSYRPTGKNIPRMFGKNHSDLQQRLDISNIQDQPLPSSSPIETPNYIHALQYPPPVMSSDPHSISSKLKRLSITTDPPNAMTTRNMHTVDQASSANSEKLFTLPPPTDENATTHFSQRIESRCCDDTVRPSTNDASEKLHGVCTPTQGGSNTEPSVGNISQSHLKPTNKHPSGHTTSTGIDIATTTLTTSAPTVPSPNPPSAPEVIKNEGSGITESQTTAQGSNLIVYSHSVIRTSSLWSGSSVDSTDDSLEVDPIQVSEQQEPECYHPVITNGGVKPASCSKSVEKQKRQRCRHCVKHKEESNMLKEELSKLQRTLSREREQSDAQAANFRDELYLIQQQAQHEIRLCHAYIQNVELRHQDAARMIHRLRMELQQVERERDNIKNAYDVSLERCHMLKAELQRVDSMQCPEYYEQCDNAIPPNPMSYQPSDYTIHTQQHSQAYNTLQHP